MSGIITLHMATADGWERLGSMTLGEDGVTPVVLDGEIPEWLLTYDPQMADGSTLTSADGEAWLQVLGTRIRGYVSAIYEPDPKALAGSEDSPADETARWKNPDDAAKHPKHPKGAVLQGKKVGGRWAPKGVSVIPNAEQITQALLNGLVSFVRSPLPNDIRGINERVIRHAMMKDPTTGEVIEEAFVKGADVDEELAAHAINEMMGSLLPMLPTVERHIPMESDDERMRGRRTFVQPWMDPDDYPTLADYRSMNDPWNASEEEAYDLALLDMVTGNCDRHERNAIVVDNHIVPVDHGRAFWGAGWTGQHLMAAHELAYGHIADDYNPKTAAWTADECRRCQRPLAMTLTPRQKSALRRLKKGLAAGGRAVVEKASSRNTVDGIVQRINYMLDKGVIPWDANLVGLSIDYPVDA